MAINERLVHTASAAAGGGTGNQEEGLVLHLDANDVDSYDGDGSIWYDIKDHEYTPSTNVSEHFNTVIYTGTGATNSITGVGFQPDFLWISDRTAGNYNAIQDSVRGINSIVFSALTSGEQTSSWINSYGQVTSFDNDGFTVSDGSGNSSSNFNQSGRDYVAWCFKAGGAAVSNTDGSITSQVSVNNDLGFSIVKWTGNNSSVTIGHGLDSTPEIVIRKSLNSTSSWAFDTTVIDGSFDYLFLNTTAAKADHTSLSSPTSTVFSTSGTTYNSSSMIAYCFTSKRGVSKVGSFVGTGAAGNKIYTGFEPAWVMIKRSTSAGAGWYIVDNKRDTNANKNKYISADSSAAEATSGSSITFNRDGFTFSGGSYNTSGHTHIYLAFAKSTNETSLIPDTDLELHLDAASYSGSGSTWTADVGSNGTLVGNTSYDEELGDWFDLDGSGDYVTTTYNINAVNDYTFEGWFNQDIAEGVIGWGMSDGVTSRQIYGGFESDGDVRLGADSGSSHLISTSQPITVGKWHHIVWVYNPSNNIRKIYVDGELVASSTSSWNRQSATRAIWIGTRNTVGSPAGDFDGKIGQFRIYDSILTQSQVRQNFNFTKPSYPNGANGAISGATWSANYFDFDGSNDVITLNDSRVSTNTVRSYSCWFNRDGNGYLIANTNGSVYGAHLRIDGGVLKGWVYDQAQSAYYCLMQSGGSTTAGTWHHAVMTWGENASDCKLYLDGTLTETETSTSGSLLTTAAPNEVRIGRYTSTYFDGQISKVKMYDKVLTQAEVTALYDEGY